MRKLSNNKITFVFPHPFRWPAGGPKIVFEYANRLAERGYQITIIFPLVNIFDVRSLFGFIRRVVVYVLRDFKNNKSGEAGYWFRFNSRVQVKYPLFLREKSVPNADFIFANTWDTAIPISRYSAQKGIKYYFVQNHDLWSASKEVINQTFKLNFKVIVIANWLKEIVEGSGGEVRAVIPNGIDLDIFKVKDPIAERKPLIGMLYHKFDWKGSADGLEALRLVKEKYPKIEAALFGVYPRPEGLPEWIKYYQNPKQADLVNLYNSFSIFISPSWFEGWPLPPAEAMACGAALVSTDIAGVSDYAINNKTALLSPIKAPEKLAENIIKLLNDDALRVQLAESGNSRIKDFSWDKAVERFIQALD